MPLSVLAYTTHLDDPGMTRLNEPTFKCLYPSLTTLYHLYYRTHTQSVHTHNPDVTVPHRSRSGIRMYSST